MSLATTTTQDIAANTLARAQPITLATSTDGILPDEGSQDWHLLITPGHVIGHRLLEVGKRFLPLAAVAAVGGAFLIGSAIFGNLAGVGGAPASVVRALIVDPASYTAIPGTDQHVDYRMGWLASAAGTPQTGLTAQGWQDFTGAAVADIRAHGTDAQAYTELKRLSVQPTITRPEKVFSEHRADLSNGVLAIPRNDPSTTAVLTAWVAGKLYALAVKIDQPINRQPNLFQSTLAQQTMSCRVIVGVPDATCGAILPSDINLLKPE